MDLKRDTFPTYRSPLPRDLCIAKYLRCRVQQIYYWLPPFMLGYWAIKWAEERNVCSNSEPGRREHEEDETGDGRLNGDGI